MEKVPSTNKETRNQKEKGVNQWEMRARVSWVNLNRGFSFDFSPISFPSFPFVHSFFSFFLSTVELKKYHLKEGNLVHFLQKDSCLKIPFLSLFLNHTFSNRFLMKRWLESHSPYSFSHKPALLVEAEGRVVMIPSQLGAGPHESETHFSLSCVAGCPPCRHPIYPNDGGVGGVTRES